MRAQKDKPMTLGAVPADNCHDNLLPAEAQDQGFTGLVYLVEINYTVTGRKEHYVGSKSFGKGRSWESYTTSSKTVRELIESTQVLGGPTFTWYVLEYCLATWSLHDAETRWILWSRKTHTRNLNFALARGEKLGAQKNKWAKPRKERFGGANNYEVG